MAQKKSARRLVRAGLVAGAILFLIYTGIWFIAAHKISHGYHDMIRPYTAATATEPPKVSGFPGPLEMKVAQEIFPIPGGSITIRDIHARGWPLVFVPATLTTGPVSLTQESWNAPLEMDSAMLRAALIGTNWTILDSALRKGGFAASLTGTISSEKEGDLAPFDLMLHLTDHESLIEHLVELGAVKRNAALLSSIGLNAFRGEDGAVHVPIAYRDNKIFAGPFVLAAFQPGPRTGTTSPPARRSAMPPSRYPGMETESPPRDGLPDVTEMEGLPPPAP